MAIKLDLTDGKIFDAVRVATDQDGMLCIFVHDPESDRMLAKVRVRPDQCIRLAEAFRDAPEMVGVQLGLFGES